MSVKSTSRVLAWWFEPQGGLLTNSDERKPQVGMSHDIDGKLVLGQNGLHGSVRLIDALKYASSSVVWRVELSGEIVSGDDKLSASRRTYIRRYNIDDVLRRFARSCALDVIHLWDAPDIVRHYLKTGNESYRDVAGNATQDAAWGTARDAAKHAAWAATWPAARDAARDAAMNAAIATSGAVTENATWDTARATQNARLEEMVVSTPSP